jgi:hypothetical protein
MQLVVGDVSERRPRRDPNLPEHLGEPRVPDPRDDALIDERLADDPSFVLASKAGDDVWDVDVLGKQVRAEIPYGRVATQREHRPVPLHGLPLAASKDEPRRPAASCFVPSPDSPASVHPQMAPHDDTVLEAQHEVLPDRLDLLETAPVDRPRHAGDEPAGVRALRLDAVADEHLQLSRDPVEGVSLGHVAQPSSAPESSTSAPKIASENVG